MQFATSLGWTLIHFIWQGFAALIVYMLVLSALRNCRPQARYLFSIGALGILSILPLATFAYLSSQSTAATGFGLEKLAAIGVSATPDHLRFELSALIEPALPYAVLAWMAGVAVMTIRFSIGLAEVSRLRRTANWDVPYDWNEVLATLIERMNITGRIELALSELVQSPLVIGWLKPLILVPPSALSGLSLQQLEMILAHELEHIRRWDYIVNLWQVIIESLLFYHPAVRIVSRQIRIDREKCCDDAAVKLCGNPILYARALAHLEGQRQGTRLAVNFQMGISDGRLLDRIQRLVGTSRHVQQGSLWFTGAFMFGILSMSAVATHYSLQSLPANAMEPAALIYPAADPVEIPVADKLFKPGTTQQAVPLMASDETPARNDIAPVTKEPVADDATNAETNALTVEKVAAEPVAPVMPDVGESDKQASKTRVKPGEAAPTAAATIVPRAIDNPVVESNQDIPGSNAADNIAQRREAVPVQQPVEQTTQEAIATVEQDSGAAKLSGGKLLHAVSPTFPRNAKRKGITGFVKVAFTIDKRGRVRDVDVVDSQPKSYFEAAALEAVKQWRFDPYREDGKPINKRAVQQIDFNLQQVSADASSRGCFRMTGSRICRELPGNAKKDHRVAIIKLD